MSEKQRDELKAENEKLRGDLEEADKLKSICDNEMESMKCTIVKLEQDVKQFESEKQNIAQNMDIGDCNEKIDELLSNLKVQKCCICIIFS